MKLLNDLQNNEGRVLPGSWRCSRWMTSPGKA